MMNDDSAVQAEKLQGYLDQIGISFAIAYRERIYGDPTWSDGGYRYSTSLTRGNEIVDFPFSTGPLIEKNSSVAIDVVSSLLVDWSAGEMDYDDFVGDFGYKTVNTKRKERGAGTWNACKRVALSLSEFFTNEERIALESLCEGY